MAAADDVAPGDAEFAGYLRNRARDLLTNDYESGDASWVTGRFGRLNAQIGAYETYDDELFGVKAFFAVSVLLRDEAATAELRKALGGLQAIEDALPYDAPQANPRGHSRWASTRSSPTSARRAAATPPPSSRTTRSSRAATGARSCCGRTSCATPTSSGASASGWRAAVADATRRRSRPRGRLPAHAVARDRPLPRRGPRPPGAGPRRRAPGERQRAGGDEGRPGVAVRGEGAPRARLLRRRHARATSTRPGSARSRT